MAEDMVPLASFLLDRPQIIKLDLSYNDFGDEGLINLVKGYLSLESNCLRHLNVIGCDLGAEGVNALCKTAYTLKLKSLRLACNKLKKKVGINLNFF